MDVHPPKNGINRYWSIPILNLPAIPGESVLTHNQRLSGGEFQVIGLFGSSFEGTRPGRRIQGASGRVQKKTNLYRELT